MPRIINPGDLKTGAGKPALVAADNLVLVGAGMVGPGPNVGASGYIPPGGILGTAESGLPELPLEGAPVDPGLIEHETGPFAHAAESVSIDAYPPLLYSDNVEGAIDELLGSVLPILPKLGQQFRYYSNYSGVPDWGPFKLKDQQFISFTTPLMPNPDLVFPLFLATPTPTQDIEYTDNLDPITDDLWNGDISALIVSSGPAQGVSGAYTAGLVINSSVQRTRVFPPKRVLGVPKPWPVCVSGTIFPADRGVLALIHWPAGGDSTAFLAQDLLDRCVAAILLGRGLSGSSQCYTQGVDPNELCDGGAGGIFEIGADSDGYYSPFAYPGRATGQYNLDEIHTGISFIDGTALPTPWTTPQHRHQSSLVPGAGQVRLGTDPGAGIDPTVYDYGIPILGGKPTAYSPAPPAGPNWGIELGSTIVDVSNFFGYRLPVLDDYSADTGLKYTPRGQYPYDTRETGRYFGIELPYNSSSTDIFETFVGSGIYYLNWAGNYRNFPEDYWTWQIARYRHSFQVLGSDVLGATVGTYWLMHFKTEANFEAFVRDGVMPWDATNGYLLYGMNPVSTTTSIEQDQNRVNQIVGAGNLVAPTYGYAAPAYNCIRAEVAIGDETVLPTPVSATSTWFLSGSVQTMWSSGVAYFTPRDLFDDPGFGFPDISATFTGCWEDVYRADSNPLTGNPGVPPATLSSSNPAFVGLAQFSYALTSGVPTFATTVGAENVQRAEYNYTLLGSNAGGIFTETNGPLAADQLTFSDVVYLDGDHMYPSFTTDGCPRVYIRRPLTDPPIQPYAVLDGHGVRMEPTNVGGAKILYHSTPWCPAHKIGGYGNFVNVGSAPANQCWPGLINPTKDTEERFLDEIYRWKSNWSAAIGVPEQAHLTGPGMAGWIAAPIAVPVRAGYDLTGSWDTASWTWQLEHLNDLSATTELQVAGLPDRNPPLDDWAQVPFPSAGMLLYPQKDYSTGYVPDAANGGVAQPDYSACVGTRSYVRCFDAGFTRNPSLPHPEVIGQPFVTLRLDGISPPVYVAPGPGDPMGTGIAVMVKIPGLTTWMDVGRSDGMGPSKQDAALDGAGCLVHGTTTFYANDPITKLRYCQLKLNVGPVANLIPGIVYGSRNEVPVLVKVIMNENAITQNLEGTGPGNSSYIATGLVGIKIVDPDDIQIASQVTGAVLI
jgi:hypothetical protein